MTIATGPVLEPEVTEPIDDRVIRIPLATMTLPPATRTNTYLARGSDGRWVVVDLGADDPAELRRLADAVQAHCGGWDAVAGLLLTHQHIDHVAGLRWWGAQVRRPVWTHERTRRKLGQHGRGVTITEIVDGDEICGMRVLHTPGHAGGHLSLDVDGGTLLAGDVVAGFGTILIDPPDGNMAEYLATLERLAAGGWSRVAPAHGGVQEGAIFATYLAHRRYREERVWDALNGKKSRVTEEIAALAYADTPGAPEHFAVRSTLAHLLGLVEGGRAVQVDRGLWRRAGPGA